METCRLDGSCRLFGTFRQIGKRKKNKFLRLKLRIYYTFKFWKSLPPRDICRLFET
jgi:hypothetical protein